MKIKTTQSINKCSIFIPIANRLDSKCKHIIRILFCLKCVVLFKKNPGTRLT